MTEHKLCADCGQAKPLSEFYKRKGSPGGYRNDCKACRCATSLRWRTENKKQSKDLIRRWRREHADRVNELNRKRYHADLPKTRKQKREGNKARRKLNLHPEKAKDQNWKNNQRRRARHHGAEGVHSKDDIKNIRRQQRDRCAVCATRLNGRGHIDHIAALSRGGSNWPKNLQLLCPSCNTSKKDRDAIEFMRSRGVLL